MSGYIECYNMLVFSYFQVLKNGNGCLLHSLSIDCL